MYLSNFFRVLERRLPQQQLKRLMQTVHRPQKQGHKQIRHIRPVALVVFAEIGRMKARRVQAERRLTVHNRYIIAATKN